MNTIGAVFQPELIEMMRSALDEATNLLPQIARTHTAKSQLSVRIIAAAAKGERDPIQLRIAALLERDDQDQSNLERRYFLLRSLREKVEQAEAAQALLSMHGLTKALDINRADMSGAQAGEAAQCPVPIGYDDRYRAQQDRLK